MTPHHLNSADLVYHNALRDILENGEERGDRTGTGTISLFGKEMRFDLTKGFPAITTKKLAFGAVVGELLWMVEGSGSDERLKQLSPKRADGRTIWTDNAEAPYWKPKAKFNGDLGRVYGVQWRSWNTYEDLIERTDDNSLLPTVLAKKTESIDQLANIVNAIKTNPNDRRMILSAWNPGELSQMALPPCHMFAQFYVSTNRKTGKKQLSCQMYMRSADMFLGVPFNIASYALLTHLIAHVTGLEAKEFILTIGDAHIYKNHIMQVREQLSRESFELPELQLNPPVTDLFDFEPEDITLDRYVSHSQIKAPMAV